MIRVRPIARKVFGESKRGLVGFLRHIELNGYKAPYCGGNFQGAECVDAPEISSVPHESTHVKLTWTDQWISRPGWTSDAVIFLGVFDLIYVRDAGGMTCVRAFLNYPDSLRTRLLGKIKYTNRHLRRRLRKSHR